MNLGLLSLPTGNILDYPVTDTKIGSTMRSKNKKHDASLNSTINSDDEGGWQVFHNKILKDGDFPAGKKSAQEKATTRTWPSSPRRPTQRSPSQEMGNTEGRGEVEAGRKTLEKMKDERLDSIFKLLDRDGHGLLRLPVHHTELADIVRRLQDADVATLIVDALSIYASTQPATKFGEEITYGDFKRACYFYFSNTGVHLSRKIFPWKTILAYDKFSSSALPMGATRALQAFEQRSSSRNQPHDAQFDQPCALGTMQTFASVYAVY